MKVFYYVDPMSSRVKDGPLLSLLFTNARHIPGAASVEQSFITTASFGSYGDARTARSRGSIVEVPL